MTGSPLKILITLALFGVLTNALPSAAIDQGLYPNAPISLNVQNVTAGAVDIAAHAWGDMDRDGDLDLVLAHRITSTGSVSPEERQKSRIFILFNTDGLFDYSNSLPIPGSDGVTTAIALGDTDNDGDLDVYAARSDFQDGLYVNNLATGGGFTSGSAFNQVVGVNTVEAGLADLDSSGTLDLVYVEQDGKLRIHWDMGSTTTESSVDLAANCLEIADIDGDGDLDLLVGQNVGGASIVDTLVTYINDGTWRNQGTITHNPSFRTIGNARPIADIAVCRLDMTSGLDTAIVIATRDAQDEIWLVDSSLQGTRIWQRPQNTRAEQVAAADLDNDGAIELAFTRDSGSTIEIYSFSDFDFSGQSGTFSEGPFGWSTGSIELFGLSLADVTSDGFLDMVGLSRDRNKFGSSFASLFVNTRFPFALNGTTLNPAAATGHGMVETGYLNDDPFLDTWEGAYGAENNLRLGGSAGLAVNPASVGVDSNTTAVAIGDVNNDGLVDLVSADEFGPLRVELAQAGGGYTTTLVDLGQVEVRGLELGDVDGDGDLDIALGDKNAPLRIYLTTTSPTGTVSYGTSPDWLSADPFITVGEMLFADLDGDTDLDLVVAQFGLNDYIYENLGMVTPNTVPLDTTPVWDSQFPSGARGIDIGDVNGDGVLDLVTSNLGALTTLFLGDLNASAVSPLASIWPLGGSADWFSSNASVGQDVAFVDIDLDGDLDILEVASRGAPSVYLNRLGSFDPEPSDAWLPQVSQANSALGVGDFDGDGDFDITFGVEGGLNLQYLSQRQRYLNSRLTSNTPPTVTIESAFPRRVTSDLQVTVRISDEEADPAWLKLQFSGTNGGAWEDALTVGSPPSRVATAPASQGGVTYTFTWDIDNQPFRGGTGVDANRVRLRAVAGDLPQRGGLTHHAPARAVSGAFTCQATPTGILYFPDAGGTSNQDINLVFVTTERLDPAEGATITVTFTGQGCDLKSPHDVIFHAVGSSQFRIDSEAAPFVNRFLLQGDDLNVDGGLTTDDFLDQGCSYDVTLTFEDAAGNTSSVTATDFTYNSANADLTVFELRDPTLTPNQDPADLLTFTNSADLQAVVSWSRCADRLEFQSGDGSGNCGTVLRAVDYGGPRCDQGGLQYGLMVPASGAETGRDVEVCALLRTGAGNPSNVEKRTILLDQVYDGNAPVVLMNNRANFILNSRSLTIVWSGFDDTGSGTAGTYIRSDEWGANWPSAPAGIGSAEGIWTQNTNIVLSNVPQGTFDVELRHQDRAGNRSDWREYVGCIDLDAPAWPGGAAIAINGQPAPQYITQERVRFSWPDIGDQGCSGFNEYLLTVEVNGNPLPSSPIRQSENFFDLDVPATSGSVTIAVAGVDNALNTSQFLDLNVEVDRVAPKIYLGGYLPIEGLPTSLYSDDLGELTVFAFAPDPDVARVELLIPSGNGFEFIPNATFLADSTPQQISLGTNCGFGAGDGFYMLCAPILDFLPPTCLMFGIRAYDRAGNGSDLWPFLNVHSLSQTGSCPSGAPRVTPEEEITNALLDVMDRNADDEPYEIATEIIDLHGDATALSEDRFTAEEREHLAYATERLREHWDAIRPVVKPLGQVGVPQTTGIKAGPTILGGGFWDSELVCEETSTFRMVMLVADGQHSAEQLQGFLYLDSTATNCQGRILPSQIFAPSQKPEEQGFSWLIDPNNPLIVGPNELGPGPYRASDFTQSPVAPYPRTGGHLFGTVFQNPDGLFSNVWPYLTVNCVPLTTRNFITSGRNVVPNGQPYQIYFEVDGGVPSSRNIGGTVTPCYNVRIEWGDSEVTNTTTCDGPIYSHLYTKDEKVQGRVTVSDTGQGAQFGCSTPVEWTFDVNVSTCYTRPGEIFADLDIQTSGDVGNPTCQADCTLDIKCQPFSSIVWELDGVRAPAYDNSTTAQFQLNRGDFYNVRATITNANDPTDVLVIEQDLVSCGFTPLEIVDCGIGPRALGCGQDAVTMVLDPLITGGIPYQDARAQQNPRNAAYDIEWTIWRTGNPSDVVYTFSGRGEVLSTLIGRNTWGPGSYTAQLTVRDNSQPTANEVTGCTDDIFEIFISPFECACIGMCDITFNGSDASCLGPQGVLNFQFDGVTARCADNVSIEIRRLGEVAPCVTDSIDVPPSASPSFGFTYTFCDRDNTFPCGFASGEAYVMDIYLDGVRCVQKDFVMP